MKQIKAILNPKDGSMTIETIGFDGASCIEATKKLEEQLGVVDETRELKPEFYNQVDSQNQQHIG